MKEIDLSDALRYLFAGLVLFGGLYVCDRSSAKALLEDLGAAGLSLLGVVGGSLAYFIYRPLIYQRGITFVQDACRPKSWSPRTYLASKCCITRHEASLLWAFIEHEYFQSHTPFWNRLASGIHFLYMTSIMALGFAVWRGVASDWLHAIVMLSLGMVIGANGFTYDRLAEDLQVRCIHSLGEEKVREYAKRFTVPK